MLITVLRLEVVLTAWDEALGGFCKSYQRLEFCIVKITCTTFSMSSKPRGVSLAIDEMLAWNLNLCVMWHDFNCLSCTKLHFIVKFILECVTSLSLITILKSQWDVLRIFFSVFILWTIIMQEFSWAGLLCAKTIVFSQPSLRRLSISSFVAFSKSNILFEWGTICSNLKSQHFEAI